MDDFDSTNWHWVGRDDAIRAWSSAASAWVNSWPTDQLTTVDTIDDIRSIMTRLGMAGPPLPLNAADVWAEYKRRLALGFRSSVSTDFDVPTSTDEHFLNMNGLVTRALMMLQSILPVASTTMHSMDGTMHNLTPQEILTVGAEMAAFKERLYARALAIIALGTIPSDYKADSRWS